MTQMIWIESQMEALEDDVDHVNQETLDFMFALYVICNYTTL